MATTESSALTSGENEDLKKFKGDQGLRDRWIKELSLVEDSKVHRAFVKHGEDIVSKYKNADAMRVYTTKAPASRVMFNVLWMNIQILFPSIFSRMGKLVAERMHRDKDPVGRLACELIERGWKYQMDVQQDRAKWAVKSAVQDRLLPGRGQVWLRYTCEFEDETNKQGELTGKRRKIPNTERVLVDTVYWQDYFESFARNPFEHRWRARRVYMTKNQIRKRFGKAIAEKIQLDEDIPQSKTAKQEQDNLTFLKRAAVYEIQDIDSKLTLWVSPGYDKAPLDVKRNPLRLNDYWQSPTPLLATTTTDSLYPTPDFKIYERLAQELDYVTKRIAALVECIRFVGAAAKQHNANIKNVLTLNDGEMWPMDNWMRFAEEGGFQGAIDWIPFEKAVAAIEPLVAYQQTLLNQINTISRIPDIMQGQSDPLDPVYTQQMKGKGMALSIREPQEDVQRFVREIYQKMVEIMFEPGLFSDESIAFMCAVDQMDPEKVNLFPQALELLRNDRLRSFRIDIETDSTIAIDELQEQETRMLYLQRMTELMGQLEQLSTRPELMKPAVESVLFAVRGFRQGRLLEYCWEEALEKIEKAQQAPPPPPPPDPQMMQVEVNKMKAESDAQVDFQKLSLEGQKLQKDMQKDAQEYQLKMREIDVKQQTGMSKTQIDKLTHDLEVFKERFDQQLDIRKIQLEEYLGKLQMSEKLMEEKRLKGEQALKTMELRMQAAQAVPDTSTSQAPQVNIVMPDDEKEISVKRAPDGSLKGTSRSKRKARKPKKES